MGLDAALPSTAGQAATTLQQLASSKLCRAFIMPMLLHIRNQPAEKCVFAHGLTVTDESHMPTRSCHRHVHAAGVGQKPYHT